MQSDLTSTTSYLASTGTKFEKEQTTLNYDPKVDKDLESAALRNAYDETLLEFSNLLPVRTKLVYKKLSIQHQMKTKKLY